MAKQGEVTHGLVGANTKTQPASGAFAPMMLPRNGKGNTRGAQQAAVASGKAELQLHPSSRTGGRAFMGDVDRHRGGPRNGSFRSLGGPPGIKDNQKNEFAHFTCACGIAFVACWHQVTDACFWADQGEGKSRGAGLLAVPFGSQKPGDGGARAKGASAASQPAQQRSTRQNSRHVPSRRWLLKRCCTVELKRRHFPGRTNASAARRCFQLKK
jgi:hypothetical protein